jgi:hypothetical protein
MSLETSAVLGLVFFGATTAAAAWLARLERSRAKIDSRPDVPTPPARSPRHSELVPAALQAFGMESSPHEDRQLISREREPENPAHVVDREAPCEDHAHVARAGAILLALVALLSWPAHATAQIDLDREIIRSGDFVEIDPPMGADSMRMTYRPGTAFEKTATIATRGGPFVWEAELSGVYLLTADDGTERAVVVRFRHAPLAGMLVFAGVLALLTIALTGTLAVSRRVARVDTTALWKGLDVM